MVIDMAFFFDLSRSLSLSWEIVALAQYYSWIASFSSGRRVP